MKLLLLALMSAALTSTAAFAAGEFRHAVFFKFKLDASPEQVQEIEKEFAGLSKKIPGIIGYEWGTSESVEELNDGFTHCFFVSFKDKAALKAYLPHEAHKAFGAKLKPLLEKVFVFDYTAKSE